MEKLKDIKYKNLIRIMTAYNIDSKRLEAILKGSKQHSSQIHKGITSLGEHTMEKIAAALGISVLEFFLPLDAGCKKDCDVQCDDKIKLLCKKVNDIVKSGYSYSGALISNIESFHEAVKEKNELERLNADVEILKAEVLLLKKVNSCGQSSGTQEEPAICTGRKRKAG